MARRAALLTQASCSVRVTPTNNGNHITAYDMNGTSDWLDYLLPEVVDASSSLDIIVQSNLCMQLASVESHLYPSHVSRLLEKMSPIDSIEPIHSSSLEVDSHRDTCSDELRVAWITPDLAYHPVSRFLFGFFSNSADKLRHNHSLVSLVDHKKDSCMQAFASIDRLKMVDLSSCEPLEVFRSLREAEYYVAVDLCGWSGGNLCVL